MNDNKTAHMAAEYDDKITATIPNYALFHSEIIDLVKCIVPRPEKWLDTGCGTGIFAVSAERIFKSTQFTLADPSKEMLDITMEKIFCASLSGTVFLNKASQDINLPGETFDVITAVQCHHYLDMEKRKLATSNCWRMLKPGGVYITFENIRPFTHQGIEIGLNRWKRFQIEKGKDEKDAEKHVGRFGSEFFPITINDHLEILKDSGFCAVEVLWASYMQAGFFAIK